MGKLFDELKEMKRAYDLKLKNEGEAAVKDAFKDIFELYPEVRSIMWAQFTPYFNDGDTCTFSVHEFDVGLTTDEGEDEYQYGETYYKLKRSNEPREVALADSIRLLQRELPEDVMEVVFGDHVRIKATRTGFDIEEYEHD